MTQLHLHTHYSILDGIGQPHQYAELAKKYNHKSMGITDHGQMGGILEFQKQMIKNDIKPLLGIEMYCVDNLIVLDEKQKRIRSKTNHAILYASNEIGYKNILNLNWLSMQDDHYYYSPRILENELLRYSEGIIMGTACLGSKLGRLVCDNKYNEAEELFKTYISIFKDNLYGEIQLNELEQQKVYNNFIIEVCKKYSIPICLTGDVHYPNPEDKELQTLSVMIARKQTIEDQKKEDFWDIEAKSLYYHSEQDYLDFNKKFNYNYSEDFIKECVSNTDYIANKINYTIPKGNKVHIPSFENKEKILKEKLKKGIEKKFPSGFPKEYQERLKTELDIIKEANLLDYFLIVEEIHHLSKEVYKDISGLGRGSGGGSMLLWLLGITVLDPIEHGLLFERFLTRERLKKDFPDIDCDFPLESKEKIQDYLKQKYGDECVLHIGTYTTLGLKSATKDICRIYNIDYKQGNDFGKELDDTISWEENISNFKNNNPILYNFYISNKKVLDLVPRLIGLIRNSGCHASGICINDEPTKNLIPVNRVNKEVCTAFQESGNNMELDELKVIKFDILGLSTLGIIRKTCESIFENYYIGEDENGNFFKIPKN